VTGIGEQGDGLQQVEADQGFVHIHLQMATRTGHGHRSIEADHLGADHRHRFALGWIHLARHDRTSRFILWKMQFRETGSGPTGEQADVIGNLEQADGQKPELSHRVDQPVMAGHYSELVGGSRKRKACEAFELRCCFHGKASGGVETRSNGCPSQGQRQDFLQAGVDALSGCSDLFLPGRRFLAEGERNRILKVGAADLHDGAPGLCFGGKGFFQLLQFRLKAAADRFSGCHMDGRREGVVGGLGTVDVVIWMDGPMAAESFPRLP